MDDTDRELLKLIIASPRTHLQDLADKLGLSKQAVYRRIGEMKRIGVIQHMTAGISYPYLSAVPVVVFGRVRTSPGENTLRRLGANERTRRVVFAGGNYVYVVGELRNIGELDGFAEFVKKVAEMLEPVVGIFCLDDGLWSDYSVDGVVERKSHYKKLSPLDLRIISSIKDDVRKPVADIAELVGATPKTVRKHLDDMISEGSLELHVFTDAYLFGDSCVVGHINVKEGSDKVKVAKRLLLKHPFREAYFRTYANLPGFLMLVFWSNKMPEIRKIIEVIGEDEDVASSMFNFTYFQRIYSTWRNELPSEQAHKSRPAEALGPRPG